MEHSDRLKATDTMNFIELVDGIYVLLNTLWGEEWGKLTMKDPLGSDFKNITLPIITYGLTEREPGLMGRDAKERKHRERETISFKDDSGKDVVARVLGRMMDYHIEFKVYETNNKRALDLSEDFMEVLEKYKGVLMGKGLQNMWLKKESEIKSVGQEDYASRRIEYLVRIEELILSNDEMIESIRVEAETLFDKLHKSGKLPSQQN